jgi:cellulose synthase/poly-beta-1,6-N-acetylglucosamine synthase-like glycosyltransferase
MIVTGMEIILVIAETAALAWAGSITAYLAILSLLSLAARRSPPRPPGNPSRFAVVVPAHNEETTIERTLGSLAGLDYPADRVELVVIADNCTDGTAAAARRAGATVLERTDASARGKGYALRWAFDTLLDRSPSFDAFVVIGADSTASPDFLRVMDAHIRAGDEAIQCADLVAPQAGSWSSEITRLGFTLYNFARPLGRGVLGGSAGLRGNGMCFSSALLRRVPWSAYGVTEDLQYGLDLLLAGVKVRFAPGARILATMPAHASNAETQRVRWEQGRLPVRRRYSRILLAAAAKRLSFPILDSWIDLVTPPFVQLTALAAGSFVLHAGLAALFPATFSFWAGAWGAVLLLAAIHVIAGLLSARADARLYLALLHVPRYAAWKFILRRKHPASVTPEDWVRTAREEDAGAAGQRRDRDTISISPHT